MYIAKLIQYLSVVQKRLNQLLIIASRFQNLDTLQSITYR